MGAAIGNDSAGHSAEKKIGRKNSTATAKTVARDGCNQFSNEKKGRKFEGHAIEERVGKIVITERENAETVGAMKNRDRDCPCN